MKVQEAAYKILGEEGRPVSSREIARIALERGWVTSRSNDPVFSVASTIEKNIRTGTYNRPELAFVRTVAGRQVGLPKWKPPGLSYPPSRRTVPVQIPEEIAEKVRLATQAKLAPSFEATVALLLKRGIAAATPDIRAAMMRQLDMLDRPGR